MRNEAVTVDMVWSWGIPRDEAVERVFELLGQRLTPGELAMQGPRLGVAPSVCLSALVREPVFTPSELRLLACVFLQAVLPAHERMRPGDTRPREALAKARRRCLASRPESLPRNLIPMAALDAARDARIGARPLLVTAQDRFTVACVRLASLMGDPGEVAREAAELDARRNLALVAEVLTRRLDLAEHLRSEGLRPARV